MTPFPPYFTNAINHDPYDTKEDFFNLVTPPHPPVGRMNPLG